MGADWPGKTELPRSLLERSFVAVDFLPQAIREGEAQRLERHEIGPDLTELVRGAAQFAAYRDRPTVFDSTGFALEDHVVIGALFDHAARLGLGTSIPIESMAGDPTSPYAFLSSANGAAPSA